MHDPDVYFIEVGQHTQRSLDHFKTRPVKLPSDQLSAPQVCPSTETFDFGFMMLFDYVGG
jgi:hypothetical protein